MSMKPSVLQRCRLCTLALAAIAAGANAADAPAAPESDPSQHVEIQAQLPSHEEHDYAELLDAMTQFEAWHATHPGTRLVFQVRARKDAAAMDGLRLNIDDPATHASVPVALDAAGRFVLPVSATLKDDGAVVRANRTNGSLAWALQVVHDADDPHDRRLGDLREECHLDLYGAKLVRGVKTPSFQAMKAVSNVCANRLVGWPAYADHPVFAVHIREGERRASLRGDMVHDGETPVVALAALYDWAYRLRDESYFPHELMADASWSDDAVLHLTFADDPADAPAAVAAGASR